jgi:hypothetical protein
MERIIALCWKPVYRFIRLKFRKNNEDAKDLTQTFFAALAVRHGIPETFNGPILSPARAALTQAC